MSNTDSAIFGKFIAQPDMPQGSDKPSRTGWSWRLATIGGIPIRAHVTFVVLLAWIAISHAASGHSPAEAAEGLLLILSVFACVVLHELSHALTAKRFGIRTRDITLLPIGGVARLERMPEQPRQELLVALAGPLMSGAIAAVLFVFAALLAGEQTALQRVHLVGGPFLTKLMWINVTLAAFNLLPAFPMDGGRVLRAALSMHMDRARATLSAARIGQSIALLLGVIGLLYNPILLFIAVFVWVGAHSEVSLSQLRSSLKGLPVSQAMVTNLRVLAPDDTLGRAVELTLAGFQRDFPVVDQHGIVGVLTHASLLRGLAEHGKQASAATAMQTHFEIVDPSEMLEAALERLQSSEGRTLIAVHQDQLVGILTPDSVGELLTMEKALHESETQGAR